MIAPIQPDVSLTASERTLCARVMRNVRCRRLRGIRTFAEQELIIPTGRYKGRRFAVARQPFMGPWLDAIDSGLWNEYDATGPSQSGKSLGCFVLPVLYHLFEVGETVIVGLPTGDMGADKWERDIWPAIQQTRYKALFPSRGRGSRGGSFDTIHFLNGATLKFMTGGGGDKSRAHFTSRVLCLTEVDGLDSSQASSYEASKIKQMEARTLSYGAMRRIYKECTVTVPEGHIWDSYTSGTESKLVLRCPHCRGWVTLERENLLGWQDAESEMAAANASAFFCNGCGEQWSEDDRVAANQTCKLLHRGQAIDKRGRVSGDPPEVLNLGFRWSAVNNLFIDAGFLGASEWRAARAVSEDDANRQMSQFYWAVPYKSANIDTRRLDFDTTRKKQGSWSKGLIPEQTAYVDVGVDIGKRLLHWVATAWFKDDAGGHTFDYGREEVPSDDMPLDVAIVLALRSLRDRFEDGWTTTEGKQRPPDQVWIDSGYMPEAIHDFIRSSDEKLQQIYRPILGRGIAQDLKRHYAKPKRTGAVVKQIGNGWHIVYMPSYKMHVVEINADIWKSRVHQLLMLKPDVKGSLTLYRGTQNDHVSFVKHMMAEHEHDEFVAGVGMVKKWKKVHANNHWLDAQYIAAAAGAFSGFSLFEDTNLLAPARGRQFSIKPIEGVTYG